MKLHTDDPRLTAYVLGELGPEEHRTIQKIIAEDPALMTEIVEIQKAQQFLASHLIAPEHQLHSAQRETLLRFAQNPDAPPKQQPTLTLMDRFKPWLIPAAAVAVLTFTTVFYFRMTKSENNRHTPSATQAPLIAIKEEDSPSQGPVDHSASPANLPEGQAAPSPPAVIQRGSVNAAKHPQLDLPIRAGKANYEWISKSILVDQKLPAPETVRLEEILNHFAFRLNGTAAIARSAAQNWHPDQRDSGSYAHTATLTTEMIACPWKPSATLLFISLKGSGNADQECHVKASYQIHPTNVVRYRLLGYSSLTGIPNAPLPSTLAANSAILLAIEIEPATPNGELGSLVWTTDDKPAPTISLIHQKDTEPSDDARFAALVCTYAQWLAGEQNGMIDAEIVSALARELASSTLSPERAEFLSLIDRSLNL